MNRLLALALLLLSASPALADNYTYYNGYYWSGNHYYSYRPGYYSYGHYYPGYYYYVGTYVAPVTYANADVQTLINIKAKEITEGSKAATFAKAARDLWPDGLPVAVGYPNVFEYRKLDYKQFHGVNAYADQVNRKDLNIAIQQAGFVLKDASGLLKDGYQGMLSIAQQDSATAASQAEREFQLRALELAFGRPRTTTTEQNLKITPAPQPMAPPAPMGKGDVSIQDSELLWQASAQGRCAKCHSGPQAKGKFEVALLDRLDRKGLEDVADRLGSKDPARFMPRKDDNTPGEKLPDAELRAWEWKLNKIAQAQGK